MTKRLTTLSVLAACILATGSSPADARGLLGEPYGSFRLGTTRPGESAVRAIDNSILGFGAGVNWPVDNNIDLNFSFSREKLSGAGLDVKSTAFTVGANVFASPRDRVCPFLIGRFGLFDTAPGGTDPLVAFGGAVQFDLTREAALTPSLVFVHAGDGDVILSGEGNYWFTDRVFGLAGIAIGLDEGDVAFTLGAGLHF
jgi:hypothetical protein